MFRHNQPQRTPGDSIGCPGFSPSPGSVCLAVHRQHYRSVLSVQGGGHEVFHPQCGGPSYSLPLRGERSSSAPSVCSGEAQCFGRLPQPGLPGPRLRMDPLPGGLSGAFPSLASDYRPVRHFPEPPSSGLLFSYVGSPGSGDRRYASEVGQPPSLRVPSFRLHPAGPRQGSPVSEPRGDLTGAILASEAVVPGSLEAPSACAGPSAYAEGSTQTTALPSLSSEPPRASHDWLSYCERSGRHLIFSSRVAHQLTHCRCSSTHITYQARWVTYRAWCHRLGHSISQPSISKIADFLLYLRRSLHLSYSSIASYRSMLSAVFRFVLPEVSSHCILHDLLRSFRIERPLSSSRVLLLLRGPPFEPLFSCSLRDLSHKVLFLISLATARRVGELQAVSASVSFSGDDCFLSYLPEFLAKSKSESASNPLPRPFRVKSLRDFVGNLPDELLLCPVRALWVYLYRTSSPSPHSRSLFVSPRTPTRPLSKNALSFFVLSVILQSLPSASFTSSSSSRSSVWAHSIRGMATSDAFPRIVSLSSILEAATWSSSTVFTSFYLRDMKFSSSKVFVGSGCCCGCSCVMCCLVHWF